MNIKNHKPVLVLIRGLPGSGKSHLAHELSNKFEKDQYISLDPDETDYNSQEYKDHVIEQKKDGVDEILHPYRFLRAKAYRAIEDRKIVIWNQPFTDLTILRNVTNRLQEHAIENHTQLPILVIEVNIDPKIAWERLIQRKNEGGHGPDKERFERFVDDYSTASIAGYETIQVDGIIEPIEYINNIFNRITELTVSQ